MDALKMDWPDNSFDLVWACESGEHMPDKKRYVEEMTRVLKPGAPPMHTLWCTSMHLHQQTSCFIGRSRAMYMIAAQTARCYTVRWHADHCDLVPAGGYARDAL